jgi:ribosomal protein L40E
MGMQTSGQGTGTGSGAIRCPDCGGLNPVGAQWCGQCLRSFAAPPPPPPPPAPVAVLEPRGSEQAIDEYFSDDSEPLGGVDPLGFDPLGIVSSEPLVGHRLTAAEQDQVAEVVPLPAHAPTGDPVTWTCRLCETPNPLAANVCEVCGSSFADTMRPQATVVTGDPNQAALYSLFWPGAGHAYLGQWGQALARAIMSAWVILVTAFLLLGAGGGASKIFAFVFALAATALWLGAAHDAHREASGQQSLVILQGRRYLYVTGSLLGLLFLMLMAVATTTAS